MGQTAGPNNLTFWTYSIPFRLAEKSILLDFFLHCKTSFVILYLLPLLPRYSVQGISGETVAHVSVEKVIQDSDIIVLTPQILVNAIEEGILSSLSIFTLMIFDECHNTTGNHPYNVLMTRYLEQKFNSSANQLPQVRLSLSVVETLEKSILQCSWQSLTEVLPFVLVQFKLPFNNGCKLKR